MPTTEMNYAWGETSETLVTVTYTTTGPVAVVTHIVESHGWPMVPDSEWPRLEDEADEYANEQAAEDWCDEDPQADALALIRLDIIRAERKLGA